MADKAKKSGGKKIGYRIKKNPLKTKDEVPYLADVVPVGTVDLNEVLVNVAKSLNMTRATARFFFDALFELIGEELGRRVQLNSLIDETGTIEEPVYVRDREGQYATYTDERVPVGAALAGYEVSVERVTLDESGLEIAAEIVSDSVYEAVPPTIYVGVQQRDAQ